MKRRDETLEVKATVAIGTAKQVADLVDKWVHIASTNFSGALQLEGSMDGSLWHVVHEHLATGSAVSEVVEVPQSWVYLRTNSTTVTSGTVPTAHLGAREARSN